MPPHSKYRMNTKFNPAKVADKYAQKQRAKIMGRARRVKTTDRMPDLNIPMDYAKETNGISEPPPHLMEKWKSVFDLAFDIYQPSMERIEQCESFEHAERQIKTLDPGIQMKVFGHMERPFHTFDYDEPDSIMWGIVIFGNGERRRWHATHIGYQGGGLTIEPLPGVPAGADHTIQSPDRAMMLELAANDRDETTKSLFDPCDPEVRYVHPETGDLIHWIEWYAVDRRIHRSAREWVAPLVQTVDGVALKFEGWGYPALQTRDVIKLLMRHHPASRSMPECDWRETSWS